MATFEELLSELGDTDAPFRTASSIEAKRPKGLRSAPLPKALPNEFKDPRLIPKLAKTPEKQLEEFRVRSAALDQGVDPDIAAGVALQESGFRPGAVSPTGVKGVMQVTKRTAKGLGFDRDDPDQNIMAGVALLRQGFDKHPDDPEQALRIYPAPKDRSFWIPNVLDHAEKARNTAPPPEAQSFDDLLASLPDLSNADPAAQAVEALGVTSAEPALPIDDQPPVEAQVPEGEEQSIINQILGKGISFAEGIKSATPVKLAELAATRAGDFINENATFPILEALGVSDERIAQSQSGLEAVPGFIQEQVEENPGTALAGSILGGLGVPALAPAKGAGLIARAVPFLAEAGISGASFEGLMNPDATPQEFANAFAQAQAGAVLTGGLIKGGQKSLRFLGERLINRFAKVKGNKQAANIIIDELGPTKSVGKLLDKTAKRAFRLEGELQDFLETQSNKTINFTQLLQSDDLLQKAINKEAVGASSQSKFILNFLAGLEQRFATTGGQMTPSQANVLKRLFWQEGFSKTGKRGTGIASELQQSLGNKLKVAIENATEGDTARNLNKALGDGKDLKRALKKLDESSGSSGLLTIPEAFALVFGGPLGVALVSGRAVTRNSAAATTVATGLSKAAQVAEKTFRPSTKAAAVIGSQLGDAE